MAQSCLVGTRPTLRLSALICLGVQLDFQTPIYQRIFSAVVKNRHKVFGIASQNRGLLMKLHPITKQCLNFASMKNSIVCVATDSGKCKQTISVRFLSLSVSLVCILSCMYNTSSVPSYLLWHWSLDNIFTTKNHDGHHCRVRSVDMSIP